jgi:hypothetical protein
MLENVTGSKKFRNQFFCLQGRVTVLLKNIEKVHGKAMQPGSVHLDLIEWNPSTMSKLHNDC